MKTKPLIDGNNLEKLILALIDGGGSFDNDRLRRELRESSPRIAEVAKRVEAGDRTVFGIPDAETLRGWLTELGRSEVEVVEGQFEPTIAATPKESLKDSALLEPKIAIDELINYM